MSDKWKRSKLVGKAFCAQVSERILQALESKQNKLKR